MIRCPDITLFVGLVLFSAVASHTAQPDSLQLMFLLDVSSTMIEPQRYIVAGSRLAGRQLRAADNVAVMSFASGTKMHLPFSSDPSAIQRGLKNAVRTVVQWSSKVRLYDAMFTGIASFPVAGNSRKRVLAVITDDIDRGSRHEAADVIRSAQERRLEVWIFLIAPPHSDSPLPEQPRISHPNVDAAKVTLRRIAESTGGGVLIRDINGYVLREIIVLCRGSEQ